jgi:hypothetical protein
MLGQIIPGRNQFGITFHSVKSCHSPGIEGGFPMTDTTAEHGTRRCGMTSMLTLALTHFAAGADMNGLGYRRELQRQPAIDHGCEMSAK